MKQRTNKVGLILAVISNGLLTFLFVSNFIQLLHIHDRVQEQLKLPVIGKDPAQVLSNLRSTDISSWQWVLNGAAIVIAVVLIVAIFIPALAKYRPWLLIASLFLAVFVAIYVLVMLFLIIHGLNHAFA